MPSKRAENRAIAEVVMVNNCSAESWIIAIDAQPLITKSFNIALKKAV